MVSLKDIEIIVSDSSMVEGILKLEQMYNDRYNNEDAHREYKHSLKKMQRAIENAKTI